MGLIAFDAPILRRPRAAVAFDDSRSAFAMSTLDDDSYAPLASMAHEIGRELGGDGLLVTWHEESAPPRHLFAEGACEAHWSEAQGVAEMGATAARLPSTSARSQWRILTGHPTSGVLTTSIPSERGVLTITTLFRRIGQSTRTRAAESAARLLPLVQPFFRTWLSRLTAVATVRALTSVVNGSDIGVLLLDRAGDVIFANTTAESLLAGGNGLRRKGTMLAADSMTDTLRLHAAIEQAVLPAAARAGRANPPIVALARREGRPLMAAVLPSDDTEIASADCAAIIYVVDPDQDLQKLVEPICAFYRLSPVETRLACELARGHSLADAAEQLRVREQTARTYLKQIFLKTDTNRQVELVRLLLLSAVRTGARGRATAG